MKLPEKLVDRISDRIINELTQEGLIEVEDAYSFKKRIVTIFKKAQEEERLLDEEAKEILRTKLDLLEETSLDFRSAFRAIRMKLAEEKNIHVSKRERINQIVSMIMDLILADSSIEIFDDPPNIRKRIRQVLVDAVKEEEDIDKEVRDRIKSYSRRIVEGTPEWNHLYRKIYEDALKRRGLL